MRQPPSSREPRKPASAPYSSCRGGTEDRTNTSSPHGTHDIDTQNDVKISFEFFPPRNEAGEERLWNTLRLLEPFQPYFVSVTYGAGGTTRERTRATVQRIQHHTRLRAAAHMTCVSATREEVLALARTYRDCGIRRIVALRGDPPQGETTFRPDPEGFDCAASLVTALREVDDFDISVAGYPEVHPEATSAEDEIEYLKRKVDAGAQRVITQVFFENEDFLRFRDRAVAAGIDVPIVPGVLPIGNFPGVARFCRSCGASIPDWLDRLFEGLDDDPQATATVGAALAAEQCRNLVAEGVDQFHFYTLNRADPTRAVCRMLGILPARDARDRSADVTRVA